MPRRSPRRGKKGGKPFQKGFDPRRHILTFADRSKGGKTTAKRYLVCGRWHTDWLDRCDRKVHVKGEYFDGEEEDDSGG